MKEKYITTDGGGGDVREGKRLARPKKDEEAGQERGETTGDGNC